MNIKQWLKGALVLVSISLTGLAGAADWAMGNTDWSQLPEMKQTKLGLYLTPKQALDMKKKDAKGVAFFDVRTRAEAMYVGWPGDADALVPFVEHPELLNEWDDRRFTYKLEANQDFVPEVARRMKEKGLPQDAIIILMCRSGDRSARAADRLQAAGYTKVYSVPEGFEGDTAKEGDKVGQRVLNGWKNTGLPWTYRLDKAKMYFSR